MKLLLPFYLTFCFVSMSCERHEALKREVAALETAVNQDNAAIAQYDKDIAALGGMEALPRMVEEAKVLQAQIAPLEFENATRERKWSAIEAEFAKLKPAAEAFKAAQLK